MQPVTITAVQPQQTTTGQPVTVIAKVQQPSGPPSSAAQPTSYVVMDDQQPGTFRQMIFNPPSVAPSQEEESQHNTSGLSSLLAAIPSVLMYQQMDTPQPFSPSQLKPTPSPVPSSTHHEQSRPASQSSQQRQPKLVDYPAQVAPNSTLLWATQIFQKQLLSCMFFPRNKKAHCPTLTPPHST